MAIAVYASAAAVLADLLASKITQVEAESALEAVRNRQEAIAAQRRAGESEVRKPVELPGGVKCGIESWGNLTLSGYDRIGHGSGRMAAALSGSALVYLLQHARPIVGKLVEGIGEGHERTEVYAKKADKNGAKTGMRHYIGAVRVAEQDTTFLEDVAALCETLDVEV